VIEGSQIRNTHIRNNYFVANEAENLKGKYRYEGPIEYTSAVYFTENSKWDTKFEFNTMASCGGICLTSPGDGCDENLQYYSNTAHSGTIGWVVSKANNKCT